MCHLISPEEVIISRGCLVIPHQVKLFNPDKCLHFFLMTIIDSKFKKGKQWLMLKEILSLLLLFHEREKHY